MSTFTKTFAAAVVAIAGAAVISAPAMAQEIPSVLTVEEAVAVNLLHDWMECNEIKMAAYSTADDLWHDVVDSLAVEVGYPNITPEEKETLFERMVEIAGEHSAKPDIYICAAEAGIADLGSLNEELEVIAIKYGRGVFVQRPAGIIPG